MTNSGLSSHQRAFACIRAAWTIAAVSGCTGYIGPGSQASEPRAFGNDLPEPPAGADLRFACDTASKPLQGVTNPGVRRLAKRELINSLRALLGDTAFADTQVQKFLTALPNDDLQDKATDFAPLQPSDYPLALLGVAERVTALLDDSAEARTRIVGACAANASVDEACASNFVKEFGARVQRRPLTDQEVADYLGNFSSLGGGMPGLKAVLARLLQSPSLAFHVELGSQVSGERTRLSDQEVASRLSFLATSSPPDQALMDAASRNGELQEVDKIKEHVERLLNGDSPPARERVKGFFTYYAKLHNVPDPFQGAANQNKIVTSGLGQEMAQEAYDYAQGTFWQTGNFSALMSSRNAYPRSEALRFILGADQLLGADGGPVLSDAAHAGLLHRPALLATVTPRTSPILRGAHIRVRYLCDVVPDPPAGIVGEAVMKFGPELENQSNRAKTDQLTGGASCAACHSQLNTLGYPFEKFDQLGVVRAQEVAMAADGSVIGTFPIDTAVTHPGIERGEAAEMTFADSQELALAIANSSKGRSCFAQRVFEFTRARAIDETADGCTLSRAEHTAHSGSIKDIFVQAIANEDILWRRTGD